MNKKCPTRMEMWEFLSKLPKPLPSKEIRAMLASPEHGGFDPDNKYAIDWLLKNMFSDKQVLKHPSSGRDAKHHYSAGTKPSGRSVMKLKPARPDNRVPDLFLEQIPGPGPGSTEGRESTHGTPVTHRGGSRKSPGCFPAENNLPTSEGRVRLADLIEKEESPPERRVIYSASPSNGKPAEIEAENESNFAQRQRAISLFVDLGWETIGASKEIAQQMGVSQRTIYRWRSDPAFKAEVLKVKKEGELVASPIPETNPASFPSPAPTLASALSILASLEPWKLELALEAIKVEREVDREMLLIDYEWQGLQTRMDELTIQREQLQVKLKSSRETLEELGA